MPLDQFLQATDGIVGATNTFQQGINVDFNTEMQQGLVNYTHLSSRNRQYTAVVSLNQQEGNFTDIQLAINAVNKIGKGTVFIKSGTYGVSANLQLYSNIDLIGEDSNTIIDFGNGGFQIQAIGTAGANLNNIHIRNITVQKSTIAAALYAIQATWVNDFAVVSCRFNNNNPSAANSGGDINTANCTRVVISDNTFTSSGSSINVGTCTTTSILRNNITDPTVSTNLAGIEIIVGTGCIIANNVISNTIVNNNLALIRCNSGVAAITNNQITSSGSCSAITLGGSISLASGNTLITSSSPVVTALNCNGTNNIISNNFIAGTWRAGVQVSLLSATGNIIIGNQIPASGWGVLLSAGLRTLVSSNYLFGNGTPISDSGSTTTNIGNITV